jgi:hypothetical protein
VGSDVTGCGGLYDGEVCTLSNTLPFQAPGHIGVVSVSTSATQVRFTVIEEGYFDSVGSTITFTIGEKNGNITLTQSGRSNGAMLHVRIVVNGYLGAYSTWGTQAAKFRKVLKQYTYTSGGGRGK